MLRHGLTRIALVDRHVLFTDCLTSALERRGYDVRGVFLPSVVPVDRVAREVRAFAPRAVILSAPVSAHGASETLVSLFTAARIPVVVIIADNDDAECGGFVARGAGAVLPMTAEFAVLCEVVQRLVVGSPVISWKDKHRLIAAYGAEAGVRHRDRDRLERLSPNEAEILRLLMAGCSPTEVARVRVVSVATVRTQVKAILSKLEVSSQISAVASAHRAGWIPRPEAERGVS